MKEFEQIERLQIIHQLIEQQKTGSPDEFAKILHISKRQLYNILGELKLRGAPIEYDSKERTYLYTNDYEISFKMGSK